jgi:hypothetical protein
MVPALLQSIERLFIPFEVQIANFHIPELDSPYERRSVVFLLGNGCRYADSENQRTERESRHPNFSFSRRERGETV